MRVSVCLCVQIDVRESLHFKMFDFAFLILTHERRDLKEKNGFPVKVSRVANPIFKRFSLLL
jgi:hypothetical protein